MKLKNLVSVIINIKILLIVFFLVISNKTFSSEKNFVVASVDRSPITYFDLKQRAKLVHFLKTKSSDYKNLNKYFELSLESLISQKLLIKKATEFNKNILKLTEKDAYKYILEREKLDVSSYDIYMGIFNKLLSEYIESNKVDIIKTLLDNNFNLETNFNLTIDN